MHPGEVELQYLERLFGFHPLDIKDCQPPVQRPKVVPRPNYLFAIFVFPCYNELLKEIETKEIDFFISKDLVVTVNDGSLIEVKNFFELLELNPELKETYFKQPIRFVAQILDELFDSCFPLLHRISRDIDVLSTSVLRGYSRQTVHEILRLKNEIVAFRKTMQPHRDMLKRILTMIPHYFKIGDFEAIAINRLIDHTKEIWDHLETYHSAIDAVEDTHSTLISFRLSEIMKTLTIFSVIIFSLTFIANIFIIPAVSIPIIGTKNDFWAIIGIMGFVTLLTLWFFKKKRYL